MIRPYGQGYSLTATGGTPVMTLKVYEVDRFGRTVRVVQPEAEVVPLETAETTYGFPACKCVQCTDPS